VTERLLGVRRLLPDEEFMAKCSESVRVFSPPVFVVADDSLDETDDDDL